MKKKYIKPEIIIIKTCNDDDLCAMVHASLYDYDKRDSIETIADEDYDNPFSDEDDIIWND